MQKITTLGCWIEEVQQIYFCWEHYYQFAKIAIFFISMCKFGTFKNPVAMITSLSELYFEIRRFILLVQMKRVISMNYGSRTSSWKPWRWVRLDLILSMRDIYINSNLNPLTNFTSSSRSTKFKDPPMEHLWNDHKDRSNQYENSHKLCDKTGHFMESQWKLRQHHEQNFSMEGKPW